MKKVLLFLLLSPLLLHSQQLRQSIPIGPNGYLIALEDDEPLQNWQKASTPLGPDFRVAKIISDEFKILHIHHQSGFSNREQLADLKNQAGVKFAQLNHPIQIRQGPPNDPYWEAQEYLHQIGTLSMWPQSLGGQTTQGTPIVLAILEPEGFDTQHEDLKPQLWTNEQEIPDDGIDNDNNGYVDDYLGWNARQGNDEHYSTIPHGTEVAGLASAATNNELGIASVGYNSKLLLLSGFGHQSGVISSYLYVLALP